MLYFLLIIIAIGVLLASQEGKDLLSWMFGVAIIGGLLYLGFWVIIIAIGLLSHGSGTSLVAGFFQLVLFVFVVALLHENRGLLFKIVQSINWGKFYKGLIIFVSFLLVAVTIFTVIQIIP